MQIPKEFMLGKRKYVVRGTKRLADWHNGRVCVETGVVSINTTRPPPKQFDTFWHEVGHAILHDMGKKWRDEAFCNAFAKRMSQVIRTAKFEGV